MTAKEARKLTDQALQHIDEYNKVIEKIKAKSSVGESSAITGEFSEWTEKKLIRDGYHLSYSESGYREAPGQWTIKW